ncbi:ClpP/crotonase-like domain-containing protein [Pilobolus umbonatus]|nr:ClpP/crotonase-like domain-containing protein [Pilobolus umbonatus]
MSQFPIALPSQDNHQMTLHREGPLFILHLHNEDNRFTTEFCTSILKALQIVEDLAIGLYDLDGMALVTVGNDKIYSNGLDLAHAISYRPFMDVFNLVLKRVLTFCIPTVAALNGHAFAGGCMLALAHDYRVMRSDRGYICMNEVDLPSALAPGMAALVREKTSPKTYRDMILQGHRYNAQQALDNELVDLICPHDQVLPKAKELALKWAPKAIAGVVYQQLKNEMYTDVVRLLGVPYHQLAAKM